MDANGTQPATERSCSASSWGRERNGEWSASSVSTCSHGRAAAISRCLAIEIRPVAEALDVDPPDRAGPFVCHPNGSSCRCEALRNESRHGLGGILCTALAEERVPLRLFSDGARARRLVHDQIREDERSRVAVRELRQRLPVVRQERSHVDERLDPLGHELGRLRRRHPAHAVRDEDDRPAGGLDMVGHAAGIRLERHVADGRRVVAVTGQVDGVDGVALRLEQRHDLLPAPGTVPGTVDEDEAGHRRDPNRSGSHCPLVDAKRARGDPAAHEQQRCEQRGVLADEPPVGAGRRDRPRRRDRPVDRVEARDVLRSSPASGSAA